MLFEFDRDNNLFNVDEAYIKGNSFKNLYDEYKNYKPYKIKINNEQDKLKMEIMMLDFYLNDLNLLLAVDYSDDVYKTFKTNAIKYNELLNTYEKKYKSLDINHDVYKYTYNSNPWPWDGEYV